MTQTTILTGKAPAATGGVFTDGTLSGNGTQASPLSVVGEANPGTFVASSTSVSLTVNGNAVGATHNGGDGLASVQKASALSGSPNPIVAGIQIAVSDSGKIVQFTGDVTLPTATWDSVTGGSGGLTPGALYFLDGTTAGDLTNTPPVATGTYEVLVGFAESPTVLRLIKSAPLGPHA